MKARFGPGPFPATGKENLILRTDFKGAPKPDSFYAYHNMMIRAADPFSMDILALHKTDGVLFSREAQRSMREVRHIVKGVLTTMNEPCYEATLYKGERVHFNLGESNNIVFDWEIFDPELKELFENRIRKILGKTKNKMTRLIVK